MKWSLSSKNRKTNLCTNDEHIYKQIGNDEGGGGEGMGKKSVEQKKSELRRI